MCHQLHQHQTTGQLAVWHTPVTHSSPLNRLTSINHHSLCQRVVMGSNDNYKVAVTRRY